MEFFALSTYNVTVYVVYLFYVVIFLPYKPLLSSYNTHPGGVIVVPGNTIHRYIVTMNYSSNTISGRCKYIYPSGVTEYSPRGRFI